jgi:hypothetical protein
MRLALIFAILALAGIAVLPLLVGHGCPTPVAIGDVLRLAGCQK